MMWCVFTVDSSGEGGRQGRVEGNTVRPEPLQNRRANLQASRQGEGRQLHSKMRSRLQRMKLHTIAALSQSARAQQLLSSPHTVPALTPRVTACMRSRLLVHTAAARPYSVSLARLITCG